MIDPKVAEAIHLFDNVDLGVRLLTPGEPLLLAHYTSVETVEQILRNKEIWFSNPLYMNDLEEMRAGILLANQIFPRFAQEAGKTPDRIKILNEAFGHYVAVLNQETALDTYVFCLCQHDHKDTDGLLSMWREYGRRGNGAALVFNTQNVSYQPDGPMMIAQVNYASPQQRLKSLESYLKGWVDIAKGITDDKLYLAAYVAFDAMKTLALVTKHCGFSEEHEWRAIYVPERDPRRYLESSLDYFVGPRGVEPRLKFKFGDAEAKDGSGEKLTTGTLSDLLHLYPAGSDCLIAARKKAFERMLKRIGKGQFIDRVYPSTIPLRPEQ